MFFDKCCILRGVVSETGTCVHRILEKPGAQGKGVTQIAIKIKLATNKNQISALVINKSQSQKKLITKIEHQN